MTPEDHLSSVSPGDLVCSKFTVDDFWYRARVLQADENSANVSFNTFYTTMIKIIWASERMVLRGH